MVNDTLMPGNTAGLAGADPVVAENLTKRFGEFTAVDRVSFKSIRERFLAGWTNGAGKTTTIRMLLGLIRPSAGKLSVLGFDPVKETKIMQHMSDICPSFLLYTTI